MVSPKINYPPTPTNSLLATSYNIYIYIAAGNEIRKGKYLNKNLEVIKRKKMKR